MKSKKIKKKYIIAISVLAVLALAATLTVITVKNKNGGASAESVTASPTLKTEATPTPEPDAAFGGPFEPNGDVVDMGNTPAPSEQATPASTASEKDADTIAYDYASFIADVDELVTAYPSIQKQVIGKTAQGRDIIALKIGSTETEERVLVVSGIRGNEGCSALLALKQIESYLTDTSTKFEMTKFEDVFSIRELWFVPMLNPDGVEINLHGANGSKDIQTIIDYSTTLGLMEKDDTSTWVANSNGIDVSINFGTGAVTDETLQSKCASRSYAGTPFESEEAAAIKRLCEETHFKSLLAVSGEGKTVEWAFGQTENAESREMMAFRLSDILGYTLGTNEITPENCTTVNVAQWFISRYNLPAITVTAGFKSTENAESMLNIWHEIATAPLFLLLQ